LEPTDEIGRVIVDLFGADLSGADLSEASLSGANLDGADLSEAGLGGAFLIKASLIRADLSGADLSGADLSGATLSGTLGGATPHWLYSSAGTPTDAIINARITPEQLASAKSYAGAILPDGTKAPG
jgi:uncharacterized protein YjbI with pentapeptide repeats